MVRDLPTTDSADAINDGWLIWLYDASSPVGSGTLYAQRINDVVPSGFRSAANVSRLLPAPGGATDATKIAVVNAAGTGYELANQPSGSGGASLPSGTVIYTNSATAPAGFTATPGSNIRYVTGLVAKQPANIGSGEVIVAGSGIGITIATIYAHTKD